MQCKTCGWWDRICHCRELNLFNTTKDQLYQFDGFHAFGKHVEVRGKDHWKKLIKERGMTDDFDQKPISPEKLVQDSRPFVPTDKRFIREQIFSELKERGLFHKLVKRRK